MNKPETHTVAAPDKTEHFDVLIVGAGISGIGAAYHLAKQCPGTSFVVLDALEGYGGTWRTHRFPGIRSDSDLYTFGYAFKPWTGAPIATAAEILRYLGEVIDENDLAAHIRYRHRISSARWSSRENAWTLDATRTDTAEAVRFTTSFLWMCQGYYRHSRGYTPEWDGMETFKGRIVHPQTWPEDLDYAGKQVVVIGSGATAATLIPAIAADCAHVTMLQRSPTFFRTGRNAIAIADELRALGIDETWIHEIVRRKILYEQAVFTRRSFTEPEAVKQELLEGARAYLGPDCDVATHFTPRYRPWRQRIAFIPDGDLFQAIRAGKASVVTEEIDRFTRTGILLKSGKVLEADIIVTATGFNLNVLGDIDFVIDGKPLVFSDTVTYRGTMFTGVPNMAWVFGYFRASWTLRADMIGEFVCRLLNHMKEKGASKVTPSLRPEDKDMQLLPWIDPENFNPGYLMRGMHLLPKRGDKPEWQHTQDYWTEKDEFPAIDLDDPAFVYERGAASGLAGGGGSGRPPFPSGRDWIRFAATRYSDTNMKITDVTLTLFAWDNIPPTTYGAHTGRFAGGSALGLLRLMTDQGLEGHAFLGSAMNPATSDGQALITHLKPVLLGKNPLDRERLNQEIWRRQRAAGVRPIGAVDVALWDIAGKAYGQPIHRLLGTYRESIGAYASSAVYASPEAYAEEALAFKANGWAAYKIHPPTQWREDIKICEAVRRAVGDDYTIMLDSTWSYDFPAAVRVGRAIEEMDFHWYEDPLADQDLYNYVKLKQKLHIPVMATEYPITGYDSYAPWIMMQATDYLRGDVAVKGGITTLVKTAHLAEAFRMNYEIHHGGNSLNNVANLHVIMAIRNTEYFEVLLPDGAQKYGLVEDITVGRDGLVHAPSKPGLGYEIDFGLIERKKISVLC